MDKILEKQFLLYEKLEEISDTGHIKIILDDYITSLDEEKVVLDDFGNGE